MPIIAWLIVIFLASSDMMSAEHTSRFIGPFLRWLIPDISGPTIVSIQLFVRKAAHVTEYAILGALLMRAFTHGNVRLSWRHVAAAWLVAVSCASLDEFHQSFVASRTGSPIDVTIDVFGAVCGLALYWMLARRKLGPGAS